METDERGLPNGSASIYLAVREQHPDLVAVRLRKPVLTALTHALEAEIAEHARQPVLFGAFQQERFLRQSLSRWRSLADGARAAVVFAAGAGEDDAEDLAVGLQRVVLTDQALMTLEWAVVCDDPSFAVVMSGWEVPDQDDVHDDDRVFEVVWSFESGAVRTAARACVRVAWAADVPGASDLVRDLAAGPAPGIDARRVSDVFARVLTQVSAGPGGGRPAT